MARAAVSRFFMASSQVFGLGRACEEKNDQERTPFLWRFIQLLIELDGSGKPWHDDKVVIQRNLASLRQEPAVPLWPQSKCRLEAAPLAAREGHGAVKLL